ncbi:MAG: leucyl aminopeptidase family protein, partial [Solirubrobacteraceae bacterium]
MHVSATTEPGEATAADTIAVGVFEDPVRATRELPAQVAELLASGEARGTFKALALAHADGRRWLLVGLGKRSELTLERVRVAAATAHARALETATRTLCWQTGVADLTLCAALVEGMVLADYRFERHKSAPAEGAEATTTRRLESLILSAPATTAAELERTVAEAGIVAEAVNAARDLQNRPGNDLTPTALADYALALAEEIESLTVEVEGRAGIEALGMGAFAAVAQGSAQEPALIVLRYEGPSTGSQPSGPLLGFVGKAVTFDSGGISLKPGAKMAEMKFDMSGGAAVLEAVAAIARLGLAVRIVAVVGATENLPDGRAVKPGDIVAAKNGKTIEINNTDAEGRL